MSTLRLRLVGGPHHDKVGWFQGGDDSIPAVLFAGPGRTGEILIVDDLNGPFATGPFATGNFVQYTRSGVEPGRHVYTYAPGPQ